MKSFCLLLLFATSLFSAQTFTKTDTLKGSNTELRNFWDVQKYELEVEPNFESKSLKGKNKISFTITKDRTNPVFQVDLHDPMQYQILGSDLKNIKAKREGDFIFLSYEGTVKKGSNHYFEIAFSGHPKVAKNAPWDGGWVFAQDEKGRPFMSVAQEGEGVAHWLPTKDLWLDEPDQGLLMGIITPSGLTGIGNGRLIKTEKRSSKNYFLWEVKNPINGYSIVPSIGHYTNFKDHYEGEKGALDLDYWVLDYNLEKAKHQFQQVVPMMKAFEYWFGPYPFYEDSFKLVETPYLGMEHQSNVAYGNGYKNGYLGRDLSGTGVGLKWDFIIIHETGHEWFANSITAKEKADMWIHEAFTSYSETLFTENYLDRQSADLYQIGTRKAIANDKPIIGHYGVARSGSGDMYYKGASMLHTLREAMNNDQKFRQMLRTINEKFYHTQVSSKEMETTIEELSGLDLKGFFDQYLRTTQVPELELNWNKQNGTLEYRFTNVVKEFTLPVQLSPEVEIRPNERWQSRKLSPQTKITVSPNYYFKVKLTEK